MSTVPDATIAKKDKLSEDEQLRLVIQDLGGKKMLKVFREHHQLLDFVSRVVFNTSSPTEARKTIGDILADARTVAGILARYKRDGNEDAARLAQNVLEDENFMLPGLDHPIEKTKLVTLLIFDFKLLLEVAKWVRVLPLSHLSERSLPKELDPLTQTVYKLLPTLGIRAESTNPIGALGHAYMDQIKTRYTEQVRLFETWMERDRYANHPKISVLNRCCGQKAYSALGYVLDMPQDEVLRLFPDRKDQAAISTWQIRIPEAVYIELQIFGFHPEDLHEGLARGGVVKSLGSGKRGYGAAWIRDHSTMERYLRSMDVHPVSQRGVRLTSYTEGEPFAFALGR